MTPPRFSRHLSFLNRPEAGKAERFREVREQRLCSCAEGRSTARQPARRPPEELLRRRGGCLTRPRKKEVFDAAA
jgi:hypothetical protein